MKKYEIEYLKKIVEKNILISVGINHYYNEKELKNCEQDALAVYDCFKMSTNIPFDEDKSKCLNEGVLCKDDFVKTLNEVCCNVCEDEKLVLFFSGHGVDVNNEFHFVFSDSDTEQMENLLSITEVKSIIRGHKIESTAMFIDACRKSTNTSKSIDNQSFKYKKKYLQHAKGIYIIYSCTSGEFSQDQYLEKQISVFTYFLVEGLRGKTSKYNRDIISMDYLYQYTLEESMKASGKIQQIRQHPSRVVEGCADVVIGFLEHANIDERFSNVCKIRLRNTIPFIEDTVRSKINFLLNTDDYEELSVMIRELLSNIYTYNVDEVECHLEIDCNSLTIIDNGKPFNPLTDLERNKNEAPQHGYGLNTLNKSKQIYRGIVDFEYELKDNFNRFKVKFKDKAFLLDELCEVKLIRKDVRKIEIDVLCLCKYYYYFLEGKPIYVSFMRDELIYMLRQIPENSKLVIVDCYNNSYVKELIEQYNDERLIYF